MIGPNECDPLAVAITVTTWRRLFGFSTASESLMRLDVDVRQDRVQEWMNLVTEHPRLHDDDTALIRPKHPRRICLRLPSHRDEKRLRSWSIGQRPRPADIDGRMLQTGKQPALLSWRSVHTAVA